MEETDDDPLATAWRELREETTLTESSLRLFRYGKPYSFIDESIGREWTINPFGFILKSKQDGGLGEDGIKLDWEHQGYKWFDPDQVNESDSFEGVPRILESLRRVWFNIDIGEEAGKTLSEGLIALQRDHESGASKLASKALDIYVNVIRKLDISSKESWLKNAKFAGWHLWKNGRESMGAPILSVVLCSLSIIDEKIPSGELSTRFVEEVVDAIKSYSQQRQNNSSWIGTSFASFLRDSFSDEKEVRILTLSSSSTITSCITHALEQGSNLDIHVLESRPLFEGVTMVSKIASFANNNGLKANITIHTDASVAIAAKNIDVVLLGADLIDESGNISNKTGSLPAVLAARYQSPDVKVVALSEKEKILPFAPPTQQEDDPQEVVESWNNLLPIQNSDATAHIEVKNIYFELIPSDLIDYYVTEDGITTTQGITSWAESARNRFDQFFSGI